MESIRYRLAKPQMLLSCELDLANMVCVTLAQSKYVVLSLVHLCFDVGCLMDFVYFELFCIMDGER